MGGPVRADGRGRRRGLWRENRSVPLARLPLKRSQEVLHFAVVIRDVVVVHEVRRAGNLDPANVWVGIAHRLRRLGRENIGLAAA
jgi:hypothetical protein